MNKYKKLKKQISTDAGVTWTDVIPYEYMKGALIERDSADCSDITWQLVYGEYICEEIEDPAEPIYEWRTVQGEYVCNGYDKCQKEAEYVSTDLGASWTATGNTRTGSTVEVDSEYCGYRPTPTDDCYITEGGGMSVGYTSISEGQTIAYKYDFTNTGCFYRETQERYSSSDTGDINYPLQYNMFFPDCDNNVAFGMSVSYFADGEGSFPIDYKFIFADCEGIVQTIFQDANIGTSSCGDAALEKSNFAVTARTLWNCITKLETSGRYTFAGIIQKDEYSKALLRFDFDTVNKTVSNVSLTVSCIHKRYRRVPVADSYICEGTDKYQAVRVYESDDDGETWTDMGIDAGLLIQADSEDCGGSTPSVMTRWVEDTGYVCVGFDKYNKEKEQESTDGGTTWTDTGNTRTGSTLIETNSEDCGYVPPTPTAKATLTYQNGDTYDVPLNGNTSLYYTEVWRGIYDTSDPHNYTKITSAVVYNNVTGVYGFLGCSNLTSVTIPNTVTAIGSFTSCSSLTNISIPNSVTSISSSTFKDCTSLSGITIPPNVTTIAESTFQNCTSLTSITIPNGVTSIGQSAFEGCTGLATITIPSSVTSIIGAAFKGCTDLTTATIGSGVTMLGISAFENCTKLTSITVEATIPPTLEWNNIFNNTNNCPIYVPAASVSAYQSAGGWSTYASRIQAIP